MQTVPWQKIQALQEEIKRLKINLSISKKKNKKETLFGILKGVKISEKDINQAKSKIFSYTLK